MDLTKVLTVRCNGHDERFDEFLNKFAVAQEKGAVAEVAAAFAYEKKYDKIEVWKRKNKNFCRNLVEFILRSGEY